MNKASRLVTLVAAVAIALGANASAADETARWTTIASEAVREAKQDPAESVRSLAVVKQAMAAAGGGGNGNGHGNGGGQSHAEHRDAAVAVAAFAVLETLYPAQREHLETQLAIALSHIPETAAKAEGAALGRRLATEIVGAMTR